MGLEFLQGLGGIVDKGETSCLSTTELCLETEDVDLVLGGLVEFCELATEFILGDVGSVWVEDITISRLLEAYSSIPPGFLQPPSSLPSQSPISADSMSVTYMTICFRPRRGFRMNLRVRRVTAESAMFATVSPEICLRARVVTGVGLLIVDGGRSRCRRVSARKFVLVTRN